MTVSDAGGWVKTFHEAGGQYPRIQPNSALAQHKAKKHESMPRPRSLPLTADYLEKRKASLSRTN